MRTARILFAVLFSLALACDAAAARSKKIASGAQPDASAVRGMMEYTPEAIAAYNQGVDALENKDYSAARTRFEAALALVEKFPEAHNNLAYTLRMQSLDNAEAALDHYNRALELAPDFAQAHYYRGVLFVQLDRDADAEKARVALVGINSDESKDYAAELAKVIKAGKAKKNQDALSIYGTIKP